MIGVMNTAMGHPDEHPLPFDLTHFKRPILFHCPADATDEERQAARAASRAELKAELSVSERDLFRDTLGRLTKKIDDSAKKSEGLVQEESAAQTALENIRAEEQRAREDSVRHDSEIEQLRQRADQAREEINKRNREIVARESRIREINSVVQARQAETRRLEDRR